MPELSPEIGQMIEVEYGCRVAGSHNDNGHPSDDVQNVEERSKLGSPTATAAKEKKESAFKSLGLLDRFLALWIFLAMLIGILLGNFVENVGPALQRGSFVGVSIPIGKGVNFSWESIC